jgi:hypothetical protein
MYSKNNHRKAQKIFSWCIKEAVRFEQGYYQRKVTKILSEQNFT